jgi:PPOX class probable F420-dependent enzyme
MHTAKSVPSIKGESNLTPELLKAIEHSQEVFIMTYDPSGKPGTVPVWFDHNQGNFYVSTYADSMKCQKIRQNPSVKLTWVTRDGPSITGTAEIVSQREILERVAPVHDGKYTDGPWDSVDHLVKMWSEAKERVLLEITVS